MQSCFFSCVCTVHVVAFCAQLIYCIRRSYIAGCLYRHNVLPLPGHPEPTAVPSRTNTLNNALNNHANDERDHSVSSLGIGQMKASPTRTIRSASSGTLSHLREATNLSSHSTPPNHCEAEPPLESKVNPWLCVTLVVIAVAFMGVTAEFVSLIPSLLAVE